VEGGGREGGARAAPRREVTAEPGEVGFRAAQRRREALYEVSYPHRCSPTSLLGTITSLFYPDFARLRKAHWVLRRSRSSLRSRFAGDSLAVPAAGGVGVVSIRTGRRSGRWVWAAVVG